MTALSACHLEPAQSSVSDERGIQCESVISVCLCLMLPLFELCLFSLFISPILLRSLSTSISTSTPPSSHSLHLCFLFACFFLFCFPFVIGVTGGVMEAALRTAIETKTKKVLPKVVFQECRGLSDIKEANLSIGSYSRAKQTVPSVDRPRSTTATSSFLSLFCLILCPFNLALSSFCHVFLSPCHHHCFSEVDGKPITLRIAIANTLTAAHTLLANMATGAPPYQYQFVGMHASRASLGGNELFFF